MIKKWIDPIFLFPLVAILFFFHSQISISNPLTSNKEKERGSRILLTQNAGKEEKEEKKEEDPQYIALLKQIKEKVDGWLKSLNERIEREDITRFEVRFLEILRNILEWVKEKIDSKLESLKEKDPKKRDILKDTHLRYSLSFKKG